MKEPPNRWLFFWLYREGWTEGGIGAQPHRKRSKGGGGHIVKKGVMRPTHKDEKIGRSPNSLGGSGGTPESIVGATAPKK